MPWLSKPGKKFKHSNFFPNCPLILVGTVLLGKIFNFSPYLTWRDMQHVVVLTSKSANLEADDWVTNGVGRKGNLVALNL